MTTKKVMMGGCIHQMLSFNRFDLLFDSKQFAVAFGSAIGESRTLPRIRSANQHLLE
jgi:hypothetical protein